MKKQIPACIAVLVMMTIVAYFAAKSCPLLDDDTLEVHRACKPHIEEPEYEVCVGENHVIKKESDVVLEMEEFTSMVLEMPAIDTLPEEETLFGKEISIDPEPGDPYIK